eukprot:m.299028 g.299028  ORF g.299028 m.299028 type:complete len:469 (+) comp15866_c0_seq27:34-1440(+)
MEALFDKAQRNAATHAKALDAMLVLYSKHAEVEEDMPFFGQFIDMFNRALIVFKREPAVERTIDFCVQFVARVADSEAETAEDQASSEISFLNAFLKHLIAASKAKDKAVRFRSCQAVCKLLNALSEDAEIDDEIWDDLQRSMLTRTQDKIPVVRVHAIGALGRLQDQNTAECPVVQAYISLLTCDSSPDVRRAALTQILIDEYTVDFVLSRARDRKDAVRKCLYETLTVKVDVASLQIEQRNMLVRTGLTDRAPEVVKACSNMICRGWYESCNKDAVEVLDLMDVETAVKDSDMLAQALLKTVGQWHEKLQDLATSLTPARALWWKNLVGHFRREKNEDEFEYSAPSPALVAKLLKQGLSGVTADDSEALFIAEQIMQMALDLDYSDEVGRQSLSSTLRCVPSHHVVSHLPWVSESMWIGKGMRLCGSSVIPVWAFVFGAMLIAHAIVVDRLHHVAASLICAMCTFV